MLSILRVMYLSVWFPERDIGNKRLWMEVFCQHKLSNQAVHPCIIMTMSNGGKNTFCTAVQQSSSVNPSTVKFVIGTMWIIRHSSSEVTIFTLGFIADYSLFTTDSITGWQFLLLFDNTLNKLNYEYRVKVENKCLSASA